MHQHRATRRSPPADDTAAWRRPPPDRRRACLGAALLLGTTVALAGEPSAFPVPAWLYPAPTHALATQSSSGPRAAPPHADGPLPSVPDSPREFTLTERGWLRSSGTSGLLSFTGAFPAEVDGGASEVVLAQDPSPAPDRRASGRGAATTGTPAAFAARRRSICACDLHQARTPPFL